MPSKTKNPPPSPDWTDGIAVIGGDVPTLPGCGPSLDDVEAELLTMPHVDADLLLADDPAIDHACRDVRQVRTAVEHLGRIPDAMEALHLLCSGRYALWDMVPAILELAAPVAIDSLHIATLGFSRQNVAEMLDALDRGRVARLSLICSHYFKGTSGGIWEFAAEELPKRPHTRFLSIRTHAKLLAIKLADGRTVTIESSANLRSCKNIEQMTVYGHPNVYAFHAGWMDSLSGREKDR